MVAAQKITQGLEKGLEVLMALNRHRGARVVDIVREVGLPRTTTLRLLRTLCANGFVARNDVDRRFYQTVKVRALADGYDDEAWLVDAAPPAMRALTADVAWPSFLATPSGAEMVVRAHTDHETTLTREMLSAGMTAPILGSASGRVYLAYGPPEHRDVTLELAAPRERDFQHLLAPAAMHALIDGIRADGGALIQQRDEYVISVPVRRDDQYLGSLAIRIFSCAMSATAVKTRYLDRLKAAAAQIERGIA